MRKTSFFPRLSGLFLALFFLFGAFLFLGGAQCAAPPAASPAPAAPAAAPAAAWTPAGEDWMLRLVNFENPMPEGLEVETALVDGAWLFDARAAGALQDMLDACRAAGHEPVLLSAYRTNAYQTRLFEDKVARVMAGTGLGREEAEAEAAREVARPGTSEHELGLAADIAAEGYGALEADYAESPVARWLAANCAAYGFILRYPEGESATTGVVFEPWHFRYVGVEAAAFIMENGLTLEAYLAGDPA